MSLWDRIFNKKGNVGQACETETHEVKTEEVPVDMASQYDLVLTNEIVNMLEERESSFSDMYPHVRSIYIQYETGRIDGFPKKFFQSHGQLESVTFDPLWEKTGTIWDEYYQTDSAFENCKALKHVVLPNAMRILGREMFKNCVALKEITLPERLERIEWGAFENCISLEELAPLKNIRQIDRDAFKGCTKLRKITILSENMERLDFGAFSGCDGLETFAVSEQKHLKMLRGIPPHRFLKEVSPGFYAFGKILAQYTGEEEAVVIPPDIEYIGAECFRDNKKVCCIKMSEEVRVIGTDAFRACKKLKWCEMPGVEYIGYGAFATSGIESVALPKLREIPGNLFENCKHLDKVIFPNSSLEIQFDSGRIFTNCEKLTEVEGSLPFRTISKAAFQNCKNLKSITLSEGTEVIGNAAFQNCTALCNVKLPQSIRVIEPNAFTNTALKEMILPDNIEKISAKAIVDVTLIVSQDSITHQYCVTKKLPFVFLDEGANNLHEDTGCAETTDIMSYGSLEHGIMKSSRVYLAKEDQPDDIGKQRMLQKEKLESVSPSFSDVGSLNLIYPVVGTDFSSERTKACESLKKGDIVILEREPDNEYDHFAIMVKSKENKQCGYLPAGLAKWLAVVLDAKKIQIPQANVKEIALSGKNGNRTKHTFMQIDILVTWDAKKYLLKAQDSESEIFLFDKRKKEILPAELYREDDALWDEYKTYCLLVGGLSLSPDIDYEMEDEDTFAVVENSASGIQFIKGANERLEDAKVGDSLTFERCFTNERNKDAIYVVNDQGDYIGYVTWDNPLSYLIDNGFIALAGGNITQLVKLSERKKENPRNRTAYLDFTMELKSSNPQKAVEEMEKWLVKYNADDRKRFSTPREPQYWHLESVISSEAVQLIEWIAMSEDFDEHMIPNKFKQKKKWSTNKEDVHADEFIELPDNIDELLMDIGMDIKK